MEKKPLILGSLCAVFLVMGSLSDVVGYEPGDSTIQPRSPLSAISISEKHPQSSVSSNSVEWDRVYGEQSSNSYSVCQDSDGNLVVTGWINRDMVLIKTDTNGNLIWNRSFDSGLNDWGTCVLQTTDGGYIVTGAVDSYHSLFDYANVGLLKYDHQGNLLWNRSMKFGGYSDGTAILQTPDQGFLIVGSTSIQSSGLLVKTDAMGSVQWYSLFGSEKQDCGISLSYGADGGYDILVRSTTSYPSNTTFWFLHIDENGSELWNRTLPTKDRWICSMKPADDGGYILVGYRYYPKLLPTDAWLLKINASGYEEWNRTYGSSLYQDIGGSVRQTPDGGYVFTGSTGTTNGYEPYTLWIVKTDKDGNEQWNRSIPSNLSGYGSAIICSSDGMFIITGNYDSKIWLLKLANEPPQKKRMAFLFGSITHLETEGVFVTFQTQNMWLVQLLPLKITHYCDNEYISISQNYTGVLRPKVIIGVSRV